MAGGDHSAPSWKKIPPGSLQEEEKKIEQVMQKLHNPKKDSVASVNPVVLVNPVLGHLETIAPTSVQEIDNPMTDPNSVIKKSLLSQRKKMSTTKSW